MESEVERFNSPFSRRGLLVLAGAWIAISAFFGWQYGRDEEGQRIIRACLEGGVLGLVFVALLIVPHQREVVLGPGTLVVRSWWQVLRGRKGSNEWAEPEGAWLSRSRSGVWQVQPRGPRLNGLQPRSLVTAFERLGFEVRDERTDWLRAHPGRHWAALVLLVCGLVPLLAALATEDLGLWLGFMGAALAMVFAASVLDSGPDWLSHRFF